MNDFLFSNPHTFQFNLMTLAQECQKEKNVDFPLLLANRAFSCSCVLEHE